MEDIKHVKAVERALKILDIVRTSSKPLGVNEIAKAAALDPATTFRMLKTLLKYDWVYQNSMEKYIIGPKISYVTDNNRFLEMLKEVSYYVMSDYSSREGQAMNLVVRNNEKCFILQQAKTNRLIDFVPPVGTFLLIYASACGKILLSGLSEENLQLVLNKTEMKAFTPNTITDKLRLIAELDKIKKCGYSIDNYETNEAAICIAVPVYDNKKNIFAAISFSGIVNKDVQNGVEYYVQVLQEASVKISGLIFGNSI